MLTEYLPILILLGLVAAFVTVVIFLSDLVSRKRLNREKQSPYECGLDPEGDTRVRISIHFYLVAVLFILFDVEAIFLILWAANAQTFALGEYGALIFAEVVAFVLILALALAYVWRKGGLEWDR